VGTNHRDRSAVSGLGVLCCPRGRWWPPAAGNRRWHDAPDIDLKLIRWYVVVRGVMGIAAVGRVRLCPDARPLRSTAKAG
jgi:hypothetical protein